MYVGKSVNHLHSHKNTEVQKKARYLVYAWKKRVDEDMKNNDMKSMSSHAISLPCKHISGEVASTHRNKGSGSPEITSKGLDLLTPASKEVSNRIGQGGAGKSASVPLGSV